MSIDVAVEEPDVFLMLAFGIEKGKGKKYLEYQP